LIKLYYVHSHSNTLFLDLHIFLFLIIKITLLKTSWWCTWCLITARRSRKAICILTNAITEVTKLTALVDCSSAKLLCVVLCQFDFVIGRILSKLDSCASCYDWIIIIIITCCSASKSCFQRKNWHNWQS
jgi:hypothetical protein